MFFLELLYFHVIFTSIKAFIKIALGLYIVYKQNPIQTIKEFFEENP